MQTTQLPTTQLGHTGLEITRVGFGAWAIGGGGWEFGWGPQDDDESIAAIQRALEQGVNWIDTAAAYGFGHSEQIVGRALDGLGDDERPYVFTKASLVPGPGRQRCEQPQARLDPARGRQTASSGSESTRSTSTRSTGRSPRATSKRAGRHSPS